MTVQIDRTFTFLVPSHLSLDWLFEFHCTATIGPYGEATITIKDENIGQVTLNVKHPGDAAKLLLYVWHQCTVLAINFVVAQAEQGASASALARLVEVFSWE